MSKTLTLLMGLSFATALAASAAEAQAASANFALFDYSDQTDVTTDASTQAVYSSPLSAKLTSGNTVTSLYVFCIDIGHEIDPPVNGLDYTKIALSTDTWGTPGDAPLSPTVVGEIGYLANYGYDLIATKASDLDDQLAAVQDAIWTIEYPASTFTPTVSDVLTTTQVSSLISADISNAAAHALPGTATIDAIVPDGGNTQGFVIAAPEPAAWALMTIGVGAIGAMLRRRRSLALTGPARRRSGSAQIAG